MFFVRIKTNVVLCRGAVKAMNIFINPSSIFFKMEGNRSPKTNFKNCKACVIQKIGNF